MTISNHITLADLHRMPVGQIAALPADQLALLKGMADEQLTQAKSLSDWLDGAISLKYADRASEFRHEAGKDTGTIRFEDDGVTVIAELPSVSTGTRPNSPRSLQTSPRLAKIRPSSSTRSCRSPNANTLPCRKAGARGSSPRARSGPASPSSVWC